MELDPQVSCPEGTSAVPGPTPGGGPVPLPVPGSVVPVPPPIPGAVPAPPDTNPNASPPLSTDTASSRSGGERSRMSCCYCYWISGLVVLVGMLVGS